MKVMVIVKATPDSEAGIMPSEKLLTEMGKFNEELVNAGVMLAGEGLHPSSKGKRVLFSGAERTVSDGPFAETKELVAGFWLWQVQSMDAAVAWVKRCPNPMLEDSIIEIRQVFSTEDFAPVDPSGELRAAEEKLRNRIEQPKLDPPRFEQGREMMIAGINVSYTAETRQNIPDQWARFVPQMNAVPNKVGQIAYGVFWNYKGGCDFDYLTGVEVQDASGLPADFTHVHVPAQRYAVFTHRQHVSAIPQTMDAIWQQWFPGSGHEAAHAPCFERYSEEFNPQTGMGGTEIWIAIKS